MLCYLFYRVQLSLFVLSGKGSDQLIRVVCRILLLYMIGRSRVYPVTVPAPFY